MKLENPKFRCWSQCKPSQISLGGAVSSSDLNSQFCQIERSKSEIRCQGPAFAKFLASFHWTLNNAPPFLLATSSIAGGPSSFPERLLGKSTWRKQLPKVGRKTHQKLWEVQTKHHHLHGHIVYHETSWKLKLWISDVEKTKGTFLCLNKQNRLTNSVNFCEGLHRSRHLLRLGWLGKFIFTILVDIHWIGEMGGMKSFDDMMVGWVIYKCFTKKEILDGLFGKDSNEKTPSEFDCNVSSNSPSCNEA